MNVTLGTMLALLTAPLVLLTLGLFTLVINAAMFSLIDFWSAALGERRLPLVPAGRAVLTALLTLVLRQVRRREHREHPCRVKRHGCSRSLPQRRRSSRSSSPCTITAQITRTSIAIVISAHTG